MDLPVEVRQAALAKLSNETLWLRISDLAIALAFRLGMTPHEVLGMASEYFGFSEEEWKEVEPRVRGWLASPDSKVSGKPAWLTATV